ncbi:hypothetical protein [Paenisporosarcina indica]|uniref:hypothetical protein n=1 Tax=Paenisporosarcina indica TaxID=650093 RepID=UPI000AFFFF13|nr:hypothetical protein [Paenisporosarcina indica]
MNIVEKAFNWMLVIGMVLLLGRIVTLVLSLMDIPFTTFFKDYSIISFLILIVGAIGTEIIKNQKKKIV